MSPPGDLLSSSRNRTSGLCSSVGQGRRADGDCRTNVVAWAKTSLCQESLPVL